MSNIYTCDTPEQLGTIQAADAIMIDDKIITREDVRKLQQERNELAANLVEHLRLHIEINAILHPDGNGPSAPSLCDLVNYVRSDRQELAATVEALRLCLSDLVNGGKIFFDADYAPVKELLAATPQQHLLDVEAKSGRAGFIAGWVSWSAKGDVKVRSDNYAASVRDGER